MFEQLAVLTGVGGVLLALWLRRRSRQCRSWPWVDGEVLASYIDDRSLETTKPVLRYRYLVAGREFIGTRVAYAGYGVSRAAMEQLIAPYQTGQPVRVYHDPMRPERAVLDNRGRSDWTFWLVSGFAFLALAAWLRQQG